MNCKLPIALFFSFVSMIAFAQDTSFYRVPMFHHKGAYSVYYKPSVSCEVISSYKTSGGDCQPVLLNAGERTVLYEADSFTIEMDKVTALYFRSKNSGRAVFLKTYVNDDKEWGEGAQVYAAPASGNKDKIEVFLGVLKGDLMEFRNIFTFNAENTYAKASGKIEPEFIKQIEPQISVRQENKVIIINIPREAFPILIAAGIKLYTGKREVKELLYMKATENVLYINDLPKGKYTYKIFAMENNELIKQGSISLVKAKK